MIGQSRYRTLLIVALVLAAARFVVLPLVSLQAEQRDNLRLLTQRLDRSESLVERKEIILTQTSRLNAAYRNARSRYPVAGSPDEYRLQVQQQISALAQECGVSITVFDVLLDGAQPDARLGFVRVRMQMQGGLSRVARFHGEFEGRVQNASLKSVNFTSSFPISGPGNPIVQAAFTADLFFTPSDKAGS